MISHLKTILRKRLSSNTWERFRHLAIGLGIIRMTPPMLADEIAAWEKKIREIGGTVNSERISVDGIVLNNCYLQFPLVVVENIYHQNYGLSLDRESIVVDIGANAGVSALFLAQNLR